MAKVFFTTNLRRHVGCAEVEARGDTVREEIPEWRQAETMKEPLDCVSAQDEIKTGVLCPG